MSGGWGFQGGGLSQSHAAAVTDLLVAKRHAERVGSKGSSRVRSIEPESQAAGEKKAPVLLDFLAQCHSHAAEDLAQSLEEGIAEGLDAERVDAADALRFDEAALDAGHHGPDVAEGDAGKEEAPQKSDGDPEDRRQDAVAPVLGHSEGSVAELPYPVQAVGAVGLGDDIFKLNLKGRKRLEFCL